MGNEPDPVRITIDMPNRKILREFDGSIQEASLPLYADDLSRTTFSFSNLFSVLAETEREEELTLEGGRVIGAFWSMLQSPIHERLLWGESQFVFTAYDFPILNRDEDSHLAWFASITEEGNLWAETTLCLPGEIEERLDKTLYSGLFDGSGEVWANAVELAKERGLEPDGYWVFDIGHTGEYTLGCLKLRPMRELWVPEWKWP